ncbi:MAG: PDZ domain-containing protein [Chitinophagaceae bacterium]
MKRYFIKATVLAAFVSLLGIPAISQKADSKDKIAENDEIIIRKKSNKDLKITVEITGGDVKVNGKALSEYNNDDVTILKKTVDVFARAYGAPRSPFQGSTWNLNANEGVAGLRANANKAFLGVSTTKVENGVKINNVTKGSPAEKAGLKEGDIITKVAETKIETPEDLSKAVGKYKPEEKVALNYLRDKKEQNVSVVLNKRTGATTYFPENFDFKNNFDFEMNTPGREGMNLILRGGSPRLGIKAQETEDGKGVKVLDVDEESNAQKAGIKEGDILTEFDGKVVNSATELMEASRNVKDKNSFKIKLLRNGKNQEVEVKIPKKLKTANL